MMGFWVFDVIVLFNILRLVGVFYDVVIIFGLFFVCGVLFYVMFGMFFYGCNFRFGLVNDVVVGNCLLMMYI